MKYRKRALVDALQYTGDNAEELETFCAGVIIKELADGLLHLRVRPPTRKISIIYSEDWLVLDKGTRIIWGDAEFQNIFIKAADE